MSAQTQAFYDCPAAEVRARMQAYPDHLVAAHYGVTRQLITRLRNAWGIPPKPRGKKRGPYPDAPAIVTAYQAGQSIRALMETYHHNFWQVRAVLVQAGVLRTRQGKVQG